MNTNGNMKKLPPVTIHQGKCKMKKWKLQTYPSGVLLAKAKSVVLFNGPHLSRLIAAMTETMIKEHGIGIAAPQMGESLRVILIKEESGIRPLCNPEITWRSEAVSESLEGCLSCPGIEVKVMRNEKVTVKFRTVSGRNAEIDYEGLMAYAAQHEIDHLNGKVIADYAKVI